MRMKKILQKGSVAGWLIPLIIVLAGLIGIVYLANKAKPNIGSQAEILTMRADDWVRGPRTAKVQMIEFGDFQCPACGAYFPVVLQLEQKFPNDLAVIFRNFPLSGHKNAYVAAQAAEAAGMQGKFWEMHDKLYSSQTEWSEANNAAEIFHGYAQGLGLDLAKFDADYAGSAVKKLIDTDRLEGIKIAVDHTPSFYVQGKLIDNPQSLEAFEALIQNAINGASAATTTATSTPLYHAHADILVVLNGKTVDFSKPEFQSQEGHELNEFTHFHNDNGKVIHLHKDGETIKDMLTAVGFQEADLTASPGKFTMTAKDGTKYNEAGDITFQLAVNGKSIDHASIFSYMVHDLDRIYLRFGAGISDTALISAAQAVSNDACIYSEKCPERGPAPKEDCVGGLGTACEAPKQ